jgi:hypothetical protein
VKGIVGDANITRHFGILQALLSADAWRDLWNSLGLKCFTFADMGIAANAPDSRVWEVCQREDVALVTDNRNEDGPDSLGATIRTFNTPRCLPVFTLSDAKRFLRSKEYGHKVTERLLEYLLDIDDYRGAGRLYLP